MEQDETVENSPEIVTHFEIPFLEENGLTKNGEPIEFDGNWVDKVSGPVIQPIVGEAGRPRKIVDSGRDMTILAGRILIILFAGIVLGMTVYAWVM